MGETLDERSDYHHAHRRWPWRTPDCGSGARRLHYQQYRRRNQQHQRTRDDSGAAARPLASRPTVLDGNRAHGREESAARQSRLCRRQLRQG